MSFDVFFRGFLAGESSERGGAQMPEVLAPHIRISNGVNDVGAARRSYFGGESDPTAFITVVREIPSRPAIRAFGTPSAASLLISAQSSKVITLQSLNAHFSSVATVQFSSVADTRARG